MSICERAELDAEEGRLLGKPSRWLAVEGGRLREEAGQAVEEVGPAAEEAGLHERLPGWLDVEARQPGEEAGLPSERRRAVARGAAAPRGGGRADG